MNKDKTLGNRIKEYEAVSRYMLMNKSYVVVRVDGKAFHTFTKDMNKPFDEKFIEAMVKAGEETSKVIMGFKLGYHQSDEFTFILSDRDSDETESWFNNNLSKIVSVTASTFTAFFNKELRGTTATFDCRAFNVPEDEVANVLIWRQRDWERNSLMMYALSMFSHKELKGKKKQDIHEMIYQKGENWANLADHLKNGTFITRYKRRISEKLNYEQINKLLCFAHIDRLEVLNEI